MLKNIHSLKLLYLLFFLIIGFSSCKEDVRVVELFEKGQLNATASTTSIKADETVTFEDNSTKVQSLSWTFQGGSPATSTAQNVTVTYSSGGTFEAKLVVLFIDNTTAEKVFTIDVEAPPILQGPYKSAPISIPGTLEVENYDVGGEGLAYHDTEAENKAVTAGSARYRQDDGIDLEVSADGSLVNIGYTAADEWVEYTVNVQASAAYDFEFFVASSPGGSAIKIQLVVDETTFTDLGELPAFPGTGGWGTYVPVKVEGINLDAGQQILRLYFTGGSVNVDKINISAPGVVVVEKYGIYTEGSATAGSIGVTTQNNSMVAISATTDAYEGSEALYIKFDPTTTNQYGVHATLLPDPSPFDASAYLGGYYNVALKTTSVGKMKIRIRDGSGGNFWVMLDDAVKTYGFERDGNWHALKIPLADFKTDGGASPDLSTLQNVFVLRSDEQSATPAAGEDWDYYVDDIYLTKE
ncbi:MAG: carbohydrate-binding protein [Bacteroidia bacterium]